MAKLSKNQSRSLVYRYLLNEGWLPPGTTRESWAEVTLADLALDDPALPAEPHLQKKRVALDLRSLFLMLGSDVPSPLAELKKKTTTLGDFAEILWASQEDA
jgi:hypothetical protein